MLHVERRHDLDAGARDAVAAVGELVHAAGRHHDGLARVGDDLLQPEPERHRALEHVEALLLLRVDVRAGHAPVSRELELELQQLAAVSAAVCRNVMRSPLTGFWIVCPVKAMFSLQEVAGVRQDSGK